MNKFQKGDIVTNDTYASQGKTFTYVRYQPHMEYREHVVETSQGELDTFVEDAGLYLVARPNTDENNAVSPHEDAVNHPAHYTAYPVEVIQLTEHMNFNRGNAVKYISRAGLKHKTKEVEDLHKAAWYINREIARIQALQ